MNFISVNSSNIKEVGYSSKQHTLGVVFNAAPKVVYCYPEVPASMVIDMIFADSVGSWFNANIRRYPDIYPYTRVPR